ncbi:hypothetical protein P3C58_18890 [Mesorhizobium sp. XAP10]|uniref:hypothetical protein n=1 Tax=unclassified Mesorhizobium TaxID=325217 RepID=UPI0023E02BDF|nr:MULTISPECIES: hypothetical protein [unclassified Mesorhizobium]MDF3154049.1 hypothetical protein [Mesorhizobium sp. XAP10]MDF3247182.1 hypothetical protein [Mesorhizobium sp. XAP4]
MGSLNHKLAQHERRRLDRTMEGGRERSMMSEDMPSLFYPGMPERTEPWTGDYEILWSIYIRCNNRQKLHRVHIPALEAIIGQPHGEKRSKKVSIYSVKIDRVGERVYVLSDGKRLITAWPLERRLNEKRRQMRQSDD